MKAPARPARRSWLVAVPLVLFALVAAGWSVAWQHVRGEVDRAFTGWLAAEAVGGREHRCPDRSIGGFPFRIEITCVAPVFFAATPTGPLEARVARVTAIALVYRPDHVVLDLASPFELRRDDLTSTVAFSRGQASVRLTQGVLDRFSLALEQPSLSLAGGRPDLAAQQVEVHARHAGPAAAPARDLDLALTARGLAPSGAGAAQGADVTFAGAARRWPAQGGDPRGLVAEWAKGGGTFELQNLRVTRGAGLLAAAGTLGFTGSGRAQGEVRASLADLSSLVGGLVVPGLGDPVLLVGSVLAFVGRPTEVEGRRATQVTVRVDDGALAIGAVQLGVLPPVF
jgi:hypothetical protein